MKRRITVLLLVVALLLLCMSGCASSQSADNAAASDMGSSGVAYYSSSAETTAPSENEEIETDILVETDDFTADTSISTIGDISADRKIIRNADIELETKEFNASVEKLQNAVTELGGYISQANVYVYNSIMSCTAPITRCVSPRRSLTSSLRTGKRLAPSIPPTYGQTM